MDRTQPRTALVAAALAALALAGCDSAGSSSRASSTPPSFDGTWTGTTTRTRGADPDCPNAIPFTLVVSGTNVRGEVRSPRDRTVTVSRFDGLIDNAGRLTARAWYGGAQNEIVGEFSGSRFSGNITSNYGCVSNLRMSRS